MRHFQVPVIVLFTKYDQFLRNVEMYLVDYPDEFPLDSKVSEVAEKHFQEQYLRPLGEEVIFVRLESEFGVKCQRFDTHLPWQGCTNETVAVMILLRRQLPH